MPAPNDREAAKYYPAIYWYAMMKIPEAEVFGGADAPANVKITDYLNAMKNNGCIGCHQLGQLATRTIPEFHMKAAKNNYEDAWVHRTQSGQAGENMTTIAAGQLGGMPYKYLANWTERVANGELPFAKPTRPQGVERNIVVTLRDWHNPKQYLHDLISTDKRYPTVNGYGPLYGSSEHAGNDMPILDPVKNVATNFVLPTTADMPLALGPGNAGSVHIARAVGLLGHGRHLGLARPTTTTRCSTGRAASGSPPPATSRTIRTSARRARRIRRRSSFRSTAPTAG